ncbi:hypothetical protein HYH03_014869 [Edaphochlamys debaryana]|uniref:Uncharacterized protein n=1 Tax=Edaphochlamys debaryana TaxID=47281 RepID=A0A835XKG6_9CHLO|nr:hypothetical protein HYH03_014869 [Edaphochlamys debaryana]|eukprot:KAG2486422.1 hypothetical protein HYH03_014869 [Edaphochlamys debaryana]
MQERNAHGAGMKALLRPNCASVERAVGPFAGPRRRGRRYAPPAPAHGCPFLDTAAAATASKQPSILDSLTQPPPLHGPPATAAATVAAVALATVTASPGAPPEPLADAATAALLLLSGLSPAGPAQALPREPPPAAAVSSTPTPAAASAPAAAMGVVDNAKEAAKDAYIAATHPGPSAPTAAAAHSLQHGGVGGQWKDYSTLPGRYRKTVEKLKALAAARYMDDHWDASRVLDVEVTWDVPPILLQGREPMRVAVWLAKWAATVHLEPLMVKMQELDDKRTSLELLQVARLAPHRPWWLPATWLLPKEIPIMSTVKLRVSKGPNADGSQDVVTAIDGVIHNAPKLPWPIRSLNALFMGHLPAATETLWSPFVGLFGDPSYRIRADEHPSAFQQARVAAANAAARAAEHAHGAVSYAADGTKGAVSYAADTVGAVADKAHGYTTSAVAAAPGGGPGHLLDKAKEGVAGAVGAVAGAVKGAAGAAASGVAGGADWVADTAGAAKAKVGGR